MDIVVLEVAPPSPLNGIQCKQTPVGEDGDVVVIEVAACKFTSHRVDCDGDVQPLEVALLQSKGGGGCGSNAPWTDVELTILDQVRDHCGIAFVGDGMMVEFAVHQVQSAP